MKARALIVGVEHYLPNTAFVDIPNAQNDAQELAKCLEGGGVEVVSVLDASRDKLREAIRRFCPKAQATNDGKGVMKMRQQYAEPLHDGAPPANTGAVGLFYFSGHGLGVNHKNLLVPSDFNVDVNATDRGAVEKKIVDSCVSLSEVAEAFSGTDFAVVVIMLDCCRNTVDGLSGMAYIEGELCSHVRPDFIVLHATSAGMKATSVSKAAPGQSSFGGALVKHIPGKTLSELFAAVTTSVVDDTTNFQVPIQVGSLGKGASIKLVDFSSARSFEALRATTAQLTSMSSPGEFLDMCNAIVKHVTSFGNVHAMLDLRVMDKIVTGLQTYSTSWSTLAAGFAAIRILADTPDGVFTLQHHSSLVEIIVEAARRFHDKGELQQAALSALDILLRSKANYSEFVKCNGVELLHDVLTNFKMAPSVAASGIDLLARLVAVDRYYMRGRMEGGLAVGGWKCYKAGFAVIQACGPGTTAILTEALSRLLFVMATFDPDLVSDGDVLKEYAAPILSNATSTKAAILRVLAACTMYLSKTLRSEVARPIMMAEYSIIHQQYAFEETILDNLTLSSIVTVLSRVLQLGEQQGAAKGGEVGDDSDVVREALWAVYLDSESRCKEVLSKEVHMDRTRSGLIAIVVAAGTKYPDDPVIVQRACGALARIARLDSVLSGYRSRRLVREMAGDLADRLRVRHTAPETVERIKALWDAVEYTGLKGLRVKVRPVEFREKLALQAMTASKNVSV